MTKQSAPCYPKIYSGYAPNEYQSGV